MFKPTWNFANEFVCPLTGVFVLVTKTNHKVPQFSVASFGRYKEVSDNRGTKEVPVKFIGIRAEKEDILSGNLEWDQFEALQKQLDLAADWIQQQHELNCKHVLEMQAEENNDSKNDSKPVEVIHNKKNKRNVRNESAGENNATCDESETHADAVN